MNHKDIKNEYDHNSKLITSLMDYHDEIKSEDTLFDDFNILTKKYQRYNEKIYDQIDDPYIELIESKDVIIKELRSQIDELKQELVDVCILYNDKIEFLRFDHRKELHTLHKQYLKQLKKNNIQ